jgi:hypothetical protein
MTRDRGRNSVNKTFIPSTKSRVKVFLFTHVLYDNNGELLCRHLLQALSIYVINLNNYRRFLDGMDD